MPEKKKNQLHQLLAVETELKGKTKVIIDETISTFSKKADHFDGIVKSYDKVDDEFQEIPPQVKEIVTTVSDKVNYTKKDVINSIDATISKEETNNSGDAYAELEIGSDKVKLSATSLLALTTYLEKVREMYKSIPTLDPTKKWEQDAKSGKGHYQTDAEIVWRSEKTPTPITLAPPTKEHPAQVELIQRDRQVGKYKTIYKSGRITPRDKADLINRIESLIINTKKAKAQANQAEVKNTKIGEKIFKHINAGIL